MIRVMQLNLKNLVAVSFLIIALSFAYYFVIFLPNKHKTEQELEKEKFDTELRLKREKELNFQSCLDTAYQDMSNNWKLNCQQFYRIDNCNLPQFLSNSIEKDYNETQELCVKKYK